MALTFDPAAATKALARADKRLARLIRQAGPYVPQSENIRSPFTALARAIVYQQLSGKAAATIFGRVKALFPRRSRLDPAEILEIDAEKLRAAGMSQAKVAALKDLAAKTLDGTVPTMAALRRMDDDAVQDRLIQVRGIGTWTVHMLLIFWLGRPDVLPSGDLGVRRGFMITYDQSELPTVDELTEHAQRWRPYRSVASWYMWRAVDLSRAAES